VSFRYPSRPEVAVLTDAGRRHAVAPPQRARVGFGAGRNAVPVRLLVVREQRVHRDIRIEHAVGEHRDVVLAPQVGELAAHLVERLAGDVGAAHIEHQFRADELCGDLQHGRAVTLAIAERGRARQRGNLAPRSAQAFELQRRQVDIAGAQIAGGDAVMAHRGFDRAVEVVEIVGTHRRHAGERQQDCGDRALEREQSETHLCDNSASAASMATAFGARGLTVNGR